MRAGAADMNWSVIATSDVDELTKPRCAGRIVNPHVVRHTATPQPDYDKMRDLAHKAAAPPGKKTSEDE
jgi:hypothetical protein